MVDLSGFDREQLEGMAEAGRHILECYRVLQKSGDNVVGEVLRGHGTFTELNHYPPGDVFDPATHCQYYYHAHRPGEHGHFHTFLRSAGRREGEGPVAQSRQPYMDERDDEICHLIAISMNAAGYPIALFTTNRWVTAENWHAGAHVLTMAKRFEIDLVPPSWPVNIWITAMVRLFAPQIADLVHQRDRTVAAWRERHPDRDVFEDRELDITSERAISVADQITAVAAALEKTG